MCVGFIDQLGPAHVAPHPDRPPPGAAMEVFDDLAAEMANLDHLRRRSIREIRKALQKQQDLELDRAEEIATLIAMTSVHPITVVRALMQFGYEPFPTSTAPRYIISGPPTAFLPNLFSYMKQLVQTKNFSSLFAGLDSAICIHIVGGVVDGFMWQMVESFMVKLNTDVRKKQSLATAFQFTLRLTITDIVVKTVTRPFKVVMLRQIASLVGDGSMVSTIQGLESGLKTGWTDLFTGLSTELRNVLLGSFLAFICRHAINRIFFYHYEKNEKIIKKSQLAAEAYEVMITAMNRFTELGLSVLFQCTVGCPFEVTSKVRAIAGTDLAIAKTLPRGCKSHRGAWSYLSIQSALFNGVSWMLRKKPSVLPEFSSDS